MTFNTSVPIFETMMVFVDLLYVVTDIVFVGIKYILSRCAAAEIQCRLTEGEARGHQHCISLL